MTQAEHERNYEAARATLARFASRSSILRLTSSEASVRFADGSLDFVYLDAQHHYEAIKDDINAWLPKVKRGGVLGGHDYLEGQLPSGLYGVKRAVHEFVEHSRYDLVVTREPDWPSWYVVVD
jgi:predicted O-methyltransferase YrrM